MPRYRKECITNLNYKEVYLSGDSIKIDLGTHQSLKIKNVHLSENKLIAKDLHLSSKHSRQDLSKILNTQRDHIDLKMPEVLFSEIALNYEDFGFSVSGNKVTIDEPELYLYRSNHYPMI